MSGTYVTNFQNVDDGDTVTVNPQNAIPQAGYLNIKKAEIQFKGESNSSTTTESRSRYNRQTDQTEVVTNNFTDRNSSSGETTATSEKKEVVKSEKKTNQATEGGSFLGADVGDTVTVSKPSIPSDAKNITVTFDYTVEEVGGASDTLRVRYDDDPYDAANFDSSEQVNIGANDSQTVFNRSVSTSINGYKRMDGASMQIQSYEGDFSDGSPTSVQIKTSFTVEYEEVSYEYDTELNRENVTTSFPDATGESVDEYKVVVERNGSVSEEFDVGQGGRKPSPITRQSGPDDNDSVTVTCITRSSERFIDTASLSVEYPSVPSGFNFDNHDIHRDGYGDNFDVIYDNREGETRTETPDIGPNDGTVELELETEFSRTITTTDDTVNPTVGGGYLEQGFDTSNVLLVVDKSDSLAGSNRNNVAKDIISSLPDSTTLSILSFNFDADISLPPDTLSNNRAAANQVIDTLPTNGGTDIQEAIETAQKNLGSTSSGTVILITDGNNFRDAENITIPQTSVNFDFLSVGVSDNINEEFLINVSSLLDGQYVEAPIGDTTVSTRLNNNEISSFQELQGFTSGEQDLTFSIQESNEAEFRLRYEWEFETPEPILGVTGFYDESAGVWREVAVTDPNSNSLEYNHVSVYNDIEEEWGALDVVDLSNPASIEAFQFYDEDEGWLAPRQYDTQ